MRNLLARCRNFKLGQAGRVASMNEVTNHFGQEVLVECFLAIRVHAQLLPLVQGQCKSPSLLFCGCLHAQRLPGVQDRKKQDIPHHDALAV
jgi:hypothetical protein